MKVNSSSGIDISDLLITNTTGTISVNIDDSLQTVLENPLSAFTDEELVAELLRRTTLGKELE